MELLGDSEGLKKHLKASGLPFKEAIIDYYNKLGQTHGFTCLVDAPLLKNGIDYGILDLVWVEPDIVFMTEFGLPQDLYEHLFKAVVLKPKKAVLILSSKSRCSPEKAMELVKHTPELGISEFVTVDVA